MSNQTAMTNQTNVNADNADLQPTMGGGGLILIGYVHEVNGANALEAPEFVATRAELLELAKYWAGIFLSRTYFVFKTRQIGSTDLRTCPFAERRVVRIIIELGDDAVKAVKEVEDKFAKSLGVREWNRFRRYLGPGHLRLSVRCKE
jgi:hypothetical protein